MEILSSSGRGALRALIWLGTAAALATGCASVPGEPPVDAASGAATERSARSIDDPGGSEISPVGEPAALAGASGSQPEAGAEMAPPLGVTVTEDAALAHLALALRQHEAGDALAARHHLSIVLRTLPESSGAGDPEKVLDALALLGMGLRDGLGHLDVRTSAREILMLDPPTVAGSEQLAAEVGFVEGELLQILARLGAAPPGADVREIFLDEVEAAIADFTGPQRAFFANAYGRLPKYWPMIEEELTRRHLPAEIAYMALVESGFQPRARSRAGARGLWQFMPGTGRLYDLDSLDDFHDSRLSTRAAAEYLLDLVGIFGPRSFLLAMASYNGGEGRVQRCLRRLDDPFTGRSFWHIRGCLPRETRDYVPRILAAAVIGRNPQRFGFELPTPGSDLGDLEVVVLPRVVSQAWVAKRVGWSLAELRSVNSDLARGSSRTPGRSFPLLVPRGRGAELRSASADPSSTGALVAGGRVADPLTGSYRVRRGDTLSTIARQHGVGYRTLASWNGLEPPYRLAVGQVLVLRGSARSAVRYTVRRGNTLQAIAQLFGVEIAEIKSWNGLGGSRLQVGQTLEIRPPRPVKVERYRVRRGDTVGAIARHFGVPVRDVLTANGLEQRSVIRPGQNLVVFDV